MFKIGDKIRRKQDDIDTYYKATSGDVVTVSDIDGDMIAIEEDEHGCEWSENFFELVEPEQKPIQPKLRWLQIEYIKNTDHPMSGLNKHVTAPVLQYWDGSDWQTVETVLETRYEHL